MIDPPGFVYELPGVSGTELVKESDSVGEADSVTGQIVVYSVVRTVTMNDSVGQSVTDDGQAVIVDSRVVKKVDVANTGTGLSLLVAEKL